MVLDLQRVRHGDLRLDCVVAHLLFHDLQAQQLEALRHFEELERVRFFSLRFQEVLHELELFGLARQLESTGSQRVRLLFKVHVQVFKRLLGALADLILCRLNTTLDILHLVFDSVHLIHQLLRSTRKLRVLNARLLSCLLVGFLEQLKRLTTASAASGNVNGALRTVRPIGSLIVVLVVSVLVRFTFAEPSFVNVGLCDRFDIVVSSQLVDYPASIVQRLNGFTAMSETIA